MNWVDYVIIGFIALSALIGLVRGLIKEVLSLLILGSAFLIASHFYSQMAGYLTKIQDSMLRNGISVALLFIATMIVGAVVNYILSQLVSRTGLTGTNMILGVVFGAFRGIVIIAVLLFFIDVFTHLPKTSGWTKSQLIPHFSGLIQWFVAYLEQNSSFLPKSPKT